MSERYLANENFPGAVVRYLRERGDDVLSAAESLIGACDEDVLEEALRQDRIVLTFDRDFGEMVFRRRLNSAPGIVLFRLKQQSPDSAMRFLKAFFDSRPKLRDMFTVSSPGQFRQIPLPNGPIPPA